MVRFFVVESIHSVLNPKFDVNVIYLRLIIFLVVGDVAIDSETFFNWLCESQDQADQSFGITYIGIIYVHIFIKVSTHLYINICMMSYSKVCSPCTKMKLSYTTHALWWRHIQRSYFSGVNFTLAQRLTTAPAGRRDGWLHGCSPVDTYVND
jgi:hypothetical protein